MYNSRSYIATPPGATIREQLIDRGMTQKEFSLRIGMSEKHISRLINGEVLLTAEMAVKLEMVLGIPAKYWNNLEAIYREKLIKINEENQMDEDIKIMRNFPYNEMVKLNWIEDTKKASERVFNLRKFFEVVKLSLAFDKSINKVVYRRLAETQKSDYALIAWAQKAKLEARDISVKPINIELLKDNLKTIKKMTTQNPSVFCEQLKELFKECGIALVFLPHLKGSYLHGATFYDFDKIVMGLTVRGKDADKFWFSLFHEIGHIILGHIDNANETDDFDEDDADDFAQEILISKEELDYFLNHYQITQNNIIKYSKIIDIDPGILVGRLQKLEHISFDRFNNLKTQYQIS